MSDRQTITKDALAQMFGKKKRPKYGAKKVADPDGGRAYDSVAEFRYANQLKLEQRMGRVVSWERQVRFTIAPEGTPFSVYVADFVVTLPGGGKRIVEVKGVWTDYALLKQKAFKLFWLPKHPEYEYVVVGGVRRAAR